MKRITRHGHEPAFTLLDLRHGAHEPDCVWMGGRSKQDISGSRLNDPALIHYEHPVRDLGHNCEIMRDEDHSEAVGVTKTADEREHLRLHSDIKCARWFVGNEQFRITCERQCDTNPLRDSPGELMGIGREDPRRVSESYLQKYGAYSGESGFAGGNTVDAQDLIKLRADRS
ncbi:hypothetical protein [Bradyrhizobium sp. Gha]|uniref:hypothetical protein n=1 Tax=Bradyrhizobium sp. Gha TaxID=1855318 RepID=UPI001FCCE37E|nr:hypothetical protein [Bradyrhizobium sp. Gha]